MAGHAFLRPDHARRLVRLYGTKATEAIGNARDAKQLGTHFGADLYEAEVRYLMEHEWALTAEDVLWRRTKRGLLFDNAATQALENFMAKAAGGTHRHAAE